MPMQEPHEFRTRKDLACDILRSTLASAKRPAALVSFGKDSLCLVSLLHEIGAQVEVAYFELGLIVDAHRFARRLVSKIPFPVTLLKPHATFVAAGASGADIAY